LGIDHAPVLPPTGPFFRNVHHSQIQHFQQAVVRWEDGFGLGNLSKLAVEPFYRVGGINKAANLLWILEICAQIRPVGRQD